MTIKEKLKFHHELIMLMRSKNMTAKQIESVTEIPFRYINKYLSDQGAHLTKKDGTPLCRKLVKKTKHKKINLLSVKWDASLAL